MTGDRRRRALRELVIGVVVLIVVLIAADRIGDAVAERIAADNLQSSQHLSSRPDVDIGGFPFLTQFAEGRYDHITVDAKDVPVKDTPVTVTTLHLDLDHVTVSRDFSDYRVASARAHGTISYAELSSVLGVRVGYAGHGRIRATKKVTVLGHTISPSVAVRPRVANGALRFTATALNGAGRAGRAASGTVQRAFDLSVPLQGIPFEVRLQKLAVDGHGLQLRLAGTDLHYRKQ